MLFFSPLMMTVEEIYLKNYIYREPINILEELNDQIHETLATVIPNMLRLARHNLIKRARLFLQMKGGHFEHLYYKLFFLFCMFFISFVAFYIV
jgi:predicted transcriptional regulator